MFLFQKFYIPSIFLTKFLFTTKKTKIIYCKILPKFYKTLLFCYIILCWSLFFFVSASLQTSNFSFQTIATKMTAAAINDDDLLSSRCQAKCLFELEQRSKNDLEKKRQLKHHIMTICKNDFKCSSCILPCSEIRIDKNLCIKNFCKNAHEFLQCKESCQFLENIRINKPGICPVTKGISNLECFATCDNDSDCFETQKCCSSGCSRECKTPFINDKRLLPIPEGITVQERKRKRSAIVRWIMKKMSPMHVLTSSNLFVIQWRWSVHQHDDTMSPWQTISVPNKMYSILKHVLVPGRYYTFRIAAVNMFGSYGFSKSSQPPFKLSISVKAPSLPNNLSIISMQKKPQKNESIVIINWQPPRSDLPLKDYRLSWWKSMYTFEDVSVLQKRRSSNKHRLHIYSKPKYSEKNNKSFHVDLNEDEEIDEYDDDFLEYENNDETSIHLLKVQENKTAKNFFLHKLNYNLKNDKNNRRNKLETRKDFHSKILPSYSTQATLDSLLWGEIYIVELYATIESSDGDLRGEPAIIVIPVYSDTNLSFNLSNMTKLKLINSTNFYNMEKKLTLESHIDENKQNETKFKNNSNNEQKFFYAKESVDTLFLKNRKTLQNQNKVNQFQHEQYGVELKTPYFEQNSLKTSLSWIYHPSCTMKQIANKPLKKFRVFLYSNSECINKIFQQNFIVEYCVANFENLQFNCDYFAEVTDLQTKELITKVKFTTASCEKTPSLVKINCSSLLKQKNLLEQDVKKNFQASLQFNFTNSNTLPINITKKLKLSILSTTENPNKSKNKLKIKCFLHVFNEVECNWEKNFQTTDYALIGYRIILEAQNNSNFENLIENNKIFNQKKFVSVVGVEEKKIRLQNLLSDTLYKFRVQPLTVHGLSANFFETFFITGSKKLETSFTIVKNQTVKTFDHINNLKKTDNLMHLIVENSLDPLLLSTSISPKIYVNKLVITLIYIFFNYLIRL